MIDQGHPSDPRDVSSRILATVSPALPAALDQAAAAPDPSCVVELAGRARPGDAALTAPLSGRPCVWYRVVTSPFREQRPTPVGAIRRAPVPQFVPSSVMPPQRASVKHSEPQRIEYSTAPFLLVGEQDAAVTVDPAQVLVDATEVTFNDFRRDERGLATALLQEWIIAPDTAVHAFGAVAAGPALVPGPAPPAIVSVHDRDELLLLGTSLARTTPPGRIYAFILVPVLVVLIVVALLVFGVL